MEIKTDLMMGLLVLIVHFLLLLLLVVVVVELVPALLVDLVVDLDAPAAELLGVQETLEDIHHRKEILVAQVLPILLVVVAALEELVQMLLLTLRVEMVEMEQHHLLLAHQ